MILQLHDIGTVYVFRTTVNGYRTQMTFVSSSLRRKREPGAKFGATVANVGDLDGDRFEDFAVAAPFENEGRGAIYIFRGAPGVVFAGKLPNNWSFGEDERGDGAFQTKNPKS